jgi:hypothetical protein
MRIGWQTPYPAGGISTSTANVSFLLKGLRAWWATPPRHGLQRLIIPWEYGTYFLFEVTHIAGGVVAAAAGSVVLAFGVYGWATFFLVLAAAHVAGGSWYLTIVRAAPART